MTILEAIQDPNLFGKRFGQPEWRAWRVLLAAALLLEPKVRQGVIRYKVSS